ncbi:hypothetical protein Cch01nite_20710 [Cellulomonas chitinilytica]|uniref:Uncharacterized protein n=1 Tax=Cellulomonas chitinilytica TaxID=398759 RepID=A0A919P399_9CELL|nr:hypothetical protein [Cellulomonas chitinilytica]GIG21347.1 hypothetical protein Cch01nite_20710 [Cellulomonas chitinilytica]
MESLAEPSSLVWRSHVTDASWARRLTHAAWRDQLARPAAGVWAALLLLLAFVVLVAPHGGGRAVLVVLAVEAAVLAGLYARSRALVARRVPVGTELGLALADDRLVTRGPQGVSDAPYAGFAGPPVVRDGVVVLRFRSNGVSMYLPAELLPGRTADDLSRRIRAAANRGTAATTVSPLGSEVVDGTTSCTVDAGYSRRLARAAYVELSLRTQVAAVALVAVVAGGVALLLASDGVPTGAVVAMAVLPLLAPCGVFAGSYVRLRRRLVQQVPAGWTYRARLGESTLRCEAPLSTWELEYSVFGPVRVRGEVVFVRVRGTRFFQMLPGALFPGPALDDLRRRIAAASPGATRR